MVRIRSTSVAGILVTVLGCLTQTAVGPYSGTCPEPADGTRVHNGEEWQDAPLTVAQVTAMGFNPALANAATAATTANAAAIADCAKDAPCTVACVIVADSTCAAYTGEDATPERAATAQLDTCALMDFSSNWPGNPAVPAKTAEQHCNLTPGCKYSGTTCVADTRDIPMLEAATSCTYAERNENGQRLGTASERKTACEAVAGCEYSNGPFLGWPSTAEACDDDEGAAMACRLTAASACGTHREAMSRTVNDNGWVCPSPPPGPAPGTSDAARVVVTGAVMLAGMLSTMGALAA